MTSKAPLGVVTRALTYEDTRLFFEAVGEYGKDFQKIEQYMAQKSQDGIRNRDQIRNFYRQLDRKLTKLKVMDNIDDRVEKVVQELYLIINYGEISKRLYKSKCRIDKATEKLLDELVHHGHTTLRVKNKNIRIRTPCCKALKKIHGIGLDEKEKVLTSSDLPKDQLVLFYPATNRDWLRVQSQSQNPRLKARLSIRKRISTLIEFLEKKWNINQTNFTLRLRPSKEHELNEVNITRVVPDNHLDLSLDAYIRKLGDKVVTPIVSTSRQASLTTPDTSMLFDTNSTSDMPDIDRTKKKLKELQTMLAGSGCDNSRTFDDTQDRSMSGLLYQQQQTLLQTAMDSPIVEEDEVANFNDSPVEFNIPKLPNDMTLGNWLTKSDNNQNNTNSVTNKMIKIEKFADGWTLADETSLTIGELYLAFKCPNKIVLEYSFEDLNQDDIAEEKTSEGLMFKLLTAARIAYAEPAVAKQSVIPPVKKKARRQASSTDDIAASNLKVQEALKQLQPTRLSLQKRTR